MSPYLSITEARQRFLELADSLGDEPLYVTRHGKPVLVVLRQTDYTAPAGAGARPARGENRETGGSPRVTPSRARPGVDRDRRLELFDRATERTRARTASGRSAAPPTGRGWKRDELYDRGRGR